MSRKPKNRETVPMLKAELARAEGIIKNLKQMVALAEQASEMEARLKIECAERSELSAFCRSVEGCPLGDDVVFAAAQVVKGRVETATIAVKGLKQIVAFIRRRIPNLEEVGR